MQRPIMHPIALLGWCLLCDQFGWGHFGHPDLLTNPGFWGGFFVIFALVFPGGSGKS